MPRVATVIGCPMHWGQPLDGTDKGPDVIRAGGLVKKLNKLGWRVKDVGDTAIPDPTPEDPVSDLHYAHNSYPVGMGCKHLYDAALAAAESKSFTLVLGGDHSIALGTVSAALKANADVGVIWVDAHADINEPDTSESRNLHGMPVSILLREVDPATVPGMEWMADVPPLKPEQLVYVGLRDVDAFEAKVIPRLNIKTFTMEHVDRYGIGAVMKKAVDYLQGRPLHLSYDIDAVDPNVATATGTIVSGGLTMREALFVAEEVAATRELVSMDLVEVNPLLADEESVERTVDLAIKVIKASMGSRILNVPF